MILYIVNYVYIYMMIIHVYKCICIRFSYIFFMHLTYTLIYFRVGDDRNDRN